MNPNWTKLYPEHAEIKQYEDEVVKQYGLREKMTFRTEVKKCVWRDDANRWLLFYSISIPESHSRMSAKYCLQQRVS
jgi:cation diffusion facilitator CzcD-associated flavoprotein CzcO